MYHYFKILIILFFACIIGINSYAQTTTISGIVSTVTDLPMAGVTIELNSGGSTLTTMTDEEGNYSFEAVAINNPISINVKKEDDHLNGVSSLDFVLGARHILGLGRFELPTDYIAMDLNKSGSVTAFDLVEMRQMILGLITEFRNNDAWRFIEKDRLADIVITENEDFEYMDNSNEFLSINSVEPLIINIIGIKIGDVNGNAAP